MLGDDRSTENYWIGSALKASGRMILLAVKMVTFLVASVLKTAKVVLRILRISKKGKRGNGKSSFG